ncbi:MAG: alanine/glycine:cation symporter family protein [Rikenellaceae bacterium]
MTHIIDTINSLLSSLLVICLPATALWFTFKLRGAQFRMIGDMIRELGGSGKRSSKGEGVSSFQAFTISIASRVGTGNLAGVATAIAVGGPGAVFWMWVVALLGGANAFVESTLAQLFKSRGEGSFIGGPAYYIKKGIGNRWFAALFAVLLIFTFGFAFNSVQSNTIASAYQTAFGVNPLYSGIIITLVTLFIIFGGIQRIAKFSQTVVPVMAIIYLLMAIVVIILRIDRIPEVFSMIISNAFGWEQALGGGIGVAIEMGVKRGLFSNEAGMGSAPNVAATADVSHPVKQGLIQSLSVYTDTLVICSCTAFIILCSGLYGSGYDGIQLTQMSLNAEVGNWGSYFIALIILFFAFTSIVGNYYYGESNIMFLTKKRSVLQLYRAIVGFMVMFGAISELNIVWSFADISMSLMTLCNLVAIIILGKYAALCLKDYQEQRREGKDPIYRSKTIVQIASKTECWDE